jgi:peptidoglycan/LPS O-acetylase OafA/YrhL
MSTTVPPTPTSTESSVPPAPDAAPRRASRANLGIAGLRGFAAIAVVFFHCYRMLALRGLLPLADDSPGGRMIQEIGPMSVCLFFCISGLLIVQSLLRHGDVKEFAVNRVARIMPVFSVLHLIMFTAGVAASYEWMGRLKHSPIDYVLHFLSNLFFLPGVFNLPIAQKNAWSLSYEALFYVLAAVGYLAFRAWHGNSKLKGAVLGLAMISATVAFLYFRPLSAFFLVGVGMYWLSKNRPELLERRIWPGWGLVGFLLGWLAFGQKPLLGLVPLAVLFFTVVTQKGWVADLLRREPFQFLGKVSYSLYLIHPFVMDPLRTITLKLLVPHIGRIPSVVFFFVVAPILAVAAATVSYNLLERKLTQRLFPKPTHDRRSGPVLQS